MDFCTWLATFQEAEEAARAAFNRISELTTTVAQLRADAAYTLVPELPDCDLLVLMSLSDGDVCPGFYDDCWRYQDAMPDLRTGRGMAPHASWPQGRPGAEPR
jgi:hypothetical protein